MKTQVTPTGERGSTKSFEKRHEFDHRPRRGTPRYIRERFRVPYKHRDVPEYEEGRSYKEWELSLMADDILYKDGWWEGRILNQDTLKVRLKREVFVGLGTPDPALVSGLYWRTHPQGRNWWSPADRDGTTRSFYKR